MGTFCFRPSSLLRNPGQKAPRNWVALQLSASAWYLQTLRELQLKVGRLNRLVGVEMALGACIASASSAFDAALGGLIFAIERKHGVLEADCLPVHKYTWTGCQGVALTVGYRTGVESAVTAALEGWSGPTPKGWLAQLRRLRNRSTHENTLNRAFGVGEPPYSPWIKVPGLGDVEPIAYLEKTLALLRDLVEAMLVEAEQLWLG